MYESTHVHRILQSLLELNVPEWSHHKLIKGADGNKYSKSDQSLTLKELRGSGVSAREIRKELGFWCKDIFSFLNYRIHISFTSNSIIKWLKI